MITTIVIALLVGMLLSLPLLKWGRRNDGALSAIDRWAWGVAAVLGVCLCCRQSRSHVGCKPGAAGAEMR
jgi:hypothetical protein